MRWGLAAALLRSARPHQWLSNLVVFTALVFSGSFFDPALLARTVAGFLLLGGLSSATFFVNDVVDRERDLKHPVRRYRPVAAGELSVVQATGTALALAAGSLIGAFLLDPAFGLAAMSYLLLMVGYSLWLRRLPVIDVMAIAAGLVLRAVAGALLIEVTISPWLYLGVGGLGLILALGRVLYEMRLAESAGTLEPGKYTVDAVERMRSLAVTFTLSVYCLFTFLASDVLENYGMMLTIPFVIYGVFRYRYLSTQRAAQHSPERLMVADLPLLIDVALWVLTVMLVQYGLG